MRSGDLDRRVQLKRRTLAAADANGQQVPSWAAYTTVWGKKEEIGGREYFAAQTKQAELTTRFTIRYVSGVLATDRLVCEGRDYEITQPPSEIGRRNRLLIFARAVMP